MEVKNLLEEDLPSISDKHLIMFHEDTAKEASDEKRKSVRELASALAEDALSLTPKMNSQPIIWCVTTPYASRV